MLFVQALLVALWVTWAMIDEQTLQLQTTRAIITGTVVGIIMGDLKTGLIVGATVELMFLASVFVGTAVAPDVTLSAAIATAIAVLSGGGTEVAIATSVQRRQRCDPALGRARQQKGRPQPRPLGQLHCAGTQRRVLRPAHVLCRVLWRRVRRGIHRQAPHYPSRRLRKRRRNARGGRLWYAADHHQMQETMAVLRHWLYCRGVPRHQQRGHRRHCCGLCFPAQLLHRQQVRADYMKEAA